DVPSAVSHREPQSILSVGSTDRVVVWEGGKYRLVSQWLPLPLASAHSPLSQSGCLLTRDTRDRDSLTGPVATRADNNNGQVLSSTPPWPVVQCGGRWWETQVPTRPRANS